MRVEITTAWSRTAARAMRLVPLMLCAALAGCAFEAPYILGDPGKYQYFNCEQLAKANSTQTVRQRELKELIDKAEQGAGGVVVSVLAYRSDYVAVNEDLRIIESTARSKNCVTPSTWQSNRAIQ
jgi:hypothetical protein